MAKASVILRFLNKSPHRAQNLFTLIRNISHNPNVEIIVSAMEIDIKYPPDIEKLRPTKLVHHFSSKKFASTTANNIGASISKTNIFIFQDADILFHNYNYDKIIEKIEQSKANTVRVGENCLDLSMENSKKIHSETSANQFHSLIRFLDHARSIPPGSRDAPGACTAINRKSFIEIGGWCELFQVYGWEDCYFRHKALKLGKYISLNEPMIHLAHETNYQMSMQPHNAHYHSQLVSANPQEYNSIIQRDKNDLLNKYPTLNKTF